MTDQHTPGEARQRLYEIIRQDVPFDEKARKALTLGTRVLAVDNGHLSRVDTETNHWKAMVTTDADDGLTPPEHELDLRETYCRHTVADNEQLALHDAPEQGYVADPAVENRGLACYLGTPLIIDDEPQGVVCFVANEPRDTPFTDAETRFAEFLSRLLERELAREHVETERASQTNLAAVFNRVLRHNLRNDMTVILGHADELESVVGDQTDAVESIRETVHDIMDVSEKAREMIKYTRYSELDRESVDVVAVVERALGCHRETHVNVAWQFDAPASADALAVGEEPFAVAVENLLDNAVEHNDADRPTVSVAVEVDDRWVRLTVADNGSGIPELEQDVFASGTETPLKHSQGLGLWLVYWHVTASGGDVSIDADSEGSFVTLSLPRADGGGDSPDDDATGPQSAHSATPSTR